MENITVIPARANSRRLPGKNTLLLEGKPLISYSIEYALAHQPLAGRVYVCTNDDQVCQVASAYEVTILDRPDSISGDHEPTVSVLQHVLESLDGTPENVILLQPTNPLRPESLLSDCFSVYLDRHCDSLFTVSRDHHKLGKIQDNCFLPFNYRFGQRSQDLEPLYFENGLLYISSANAIKAGALANERSYPFLVEHPFASVDIDTEADFSYAEYLLKQHIETK